MLAQDFQRNFSPWFPYINKPDKFIKHLPE